jgi:hypothetical protein
MSKSQGYAILVPLWLLVVLAGADYSTLLVWIAGMNAMVALILSCAAMIWSCAATLHEEKP